MIWCCIQDALTSKTIERRFERDAVQEKCLWPMFIAALIYVLLDGVLLVLFTQLLSIVFYPRTPRLVFTLGLFIFIEDTGFRMHSNKMRDKF